MSCNCNCNPNFHKSVSLTATGTITVTNPNNVSNLDPFIFVLTTNPSNIITGAPVNLSVVINGGEVPIHNRLGLPISSDRLRVRKSYYGYYVVPTTGTPYVIFLNTPCNIAFAMSSASAAVTQGSDSGTNNSSSTRSSSKS